MDVLYKREAIKDQPIIKWEGMKAESDGVPLDSHNMKILSVAFEGEFRGAQVVLEGAIGDVFYLLTTPHGSIVMATLAKITTVSGRYVRVRPKVMGGTDETDIKVIIFGQNIR